MKEQLVNGVKSTAGKFGKKLWVVGAAVAGLAVAGYVLKSKSDNEDEMITTVEEPIEEVESEDINESEE